MTKKVMRVAFAMLAVACLTWAGPSSWTGTVSDAACGMTQHDAACIEKCVAAGGKYILVSKNKVYTLKPQDKFKGLGGKRVKVTGTLTGDSAITADSVSVK